MHDERPSRAGPGSAPSWRRTLPRLVAARVAGCAAFAGLEVVLYLLSTHSYIGDSDKASTVLEGQALGNGHLLLHGWTITLDSFWTLDQSFYAVATRAGISTSLLHSGPAFFAGLLVVAGIAAARDGRRDRGALVGTVVVVALLVCPTPTFSWWYLGFAYHVSTALFAVVAFLAVGKGGFGRWWCLAVVLLTLGIVGDLLMVAYGVVPVLLAGLVAMLRRRAWRAGAPSVAAALASSALALLTRQVVKALGGFGLGPPLPTAHLHQALANVVEAFRYGADLVGLTNLLAGNVPAPLLDLHVVGAVCMLSCFLAAASSLLVGAVRGGAPGRLAGAGAGAGEPWRVDDMLVLATFGPAATYLGLSRVGGAGPVRYLAVSILFLAILSGRVTARAWPRLPTGAARRAVAAGGVLVLLGFGAGLGYELAPPAPGNPAIGLAAWLDAHHLRQGVGEYGSASITTVVSGGAVTVRPVAPGPGGSLSPMPYHSCACWYAGEKFQFFVYRVPVVAGIDAAAAARTWGPPVRTYVVGDYRILVWAAPITVAPA